MTTTIKAGMRFTHRFEKDSKGRPVICTIKSVNGLTTEFRTSNSRTWEVETTKIQNIVKEWV